MKEILLVIGFKEEMNIAWGNKKVLQTLFYCDPYLRK